MNRPKPRQLEPDAFCINDGVETGIHVREGCPLCGDCYRQYRARLVAPEARTVASAQPPAQLDLVEAAA